MRTKKIILFVLVIFFILPVFLPSNGSGQTCGIYPDGILITSDPTPEDGMDTDEDLITLSWWWWEFFEPPNVYCDFEVFRFEVTMYNVDYPLGIEAYVIQGSNYTLQDIPLSLTFNLSNYVKYRDDMTFGIFIGIWALVEQTSQFPSYYTWYEVRWSPQPIEPRTIIIIPNYVYIVFPILGLMTMTYYLYWRTTCKNTDNWDDERCVKKRTYIKQKEQEVKQQQEELGTKLFGELP